MVNSEEFVTRLQQVMDHYQLSSAAFAESIGVQRSSISHLLSGRNKPSLDFVMRVVRTYPEVNLYWLLNGKGAFPIESVSQVPESQQQDLSPAPSESKELPLPAEMEKIKGRKVIDRIIIFYSDGSFESFSNK